MPSLFNRLATLFKAKAAEGEVRPGPYTLPVSGGWLSAEAGQFWNFWQMGFDVESGSTRSAMVSACVGAYAQSVAMLPGDHWRLHDDGGRERVTNSDLSRVLKRPNSYSTISDFLMNLVYGLYLTGNAYALALRNARYEITELHLMNPRMSRPQVATNGEVFYALGGNQVVDRLIQPPLIVPQRDVLHVRLHASQHDMLIGKSPLWACANDLAAGDAMLQQQIAFYANQARPSAVCVLT